MVTKNCVEKSNLCFSLMNRGDRFIEEPALEVAAKMMAHEKPESLIGQQLGSYQILSLLGAGGMGVVYKARDARLNRSVAIKVLPPDKVSDPERKRRFIQEARAASALNHPNIITLTISGAIAASTSSSWSTCQARRWISGSRGRGCD